MNRTWYLIFAGLAVVLGAPVMVALAWLAEEALRIYIGY